MEKNIPADELEKHKIDLLSSVKETAYDEDVESDMEEFISNKDEIKRTSESIFSKKK